MEIAINAAISLDGFISKLDGDSDWVVDDELFEQAVNEYGCIVMGRTTFDQYEGDLYPMDGVQNLVLTSKTDQSKYKNVHFVDSPEAAIAKAKELGFDKLLVIGGAQTNGAFMATGKVTKLLIDEHSLTLGKGKPLFGEFTKPANLQLTGSKPYPEGYVHLEYDVRG